MIFLFWFLQYFPCDVIVDGDDEIVIMVFDETLHVGEGVLVIEFSGILNEHLTGFYKWFLLFPLYVKILST